MDSGIRSHNPLSVIRPIAEAARVLVGRKLAGRGLTVYDDDVFIVSYPRSGNTWLRFLIGNLVYRHSPVTFANLESRIPEIYLFPDHVLRRLPRPRILKSHECFDPHYKRVVYIVRDPRDVAVSYYHYAIKRNRIPENYPIEQFVPRFLNAEFDREWQWAASWGDHVTSWLSLRQGREGFLLLRYEDVLNDTAQALSRMATFLQLEPAEDRLARAVQFSSRDRMRELEKSEGRNWKLTKATRQDKPFIRTACSGVWRRELPSSSVAQVECAFASVMKILGYELSSAVASQQAEVITT